MKSRLLLITQWFDPEPILKGLTFARALVNQGFEVEVLTGFPNYPGGKIYPGYKLKLIQREKIQGVNITRLPLYPSHDNSSLGRLINYFTFSFSVLIYGLFRAKKSDVIYAYHPPLTVGLAACIIKAFRRSSVVYDIQDIWPDTLRSTGMIKNESILALTTMVCNFVYKKVNIIVVLSEGFKKLLVERGVPSNKIKVIYNWANEENIHQCKLKYPDNFPNMDRFIILFAGNMGKAQALEAVIDAMHIVKSDFPNVSLVMMGGGVEASFLENYAKQNSIDNVVFLPSVSMSHINTYLQAADVLLVHLRNDPLFRITIPSKTQAYMAAGKPILMAVDGEAAKLVEVAGCGLVAKPEHKIDIARVIKIFANLDQEDLDKFGYNGKKYYGSVLSLEHGVQQFSEIFRQFN